MTATVQPVPTAAEKKQPNRQRQHVERFRTDDEEHAAITALARDSGLSFGAFIRASTIGNPGPRSKRATPTEQGRLTREHVIALNRVGGNINQGIRALNEIALKAPEASSRDELAVQIAGLRLLFEKGMAELMPVLEANRAAFG